MKKSWKLYILLGIIMIVVVSLSYFIFGTRKIIEKKIILKNGVSINLELTEKKWVISEPEVEKFINIEHKKGTLKYSYWSNDYSYELSLICDSLGQCYWLIDDRFAGVIRISSTSHGSNFEAKGFHYDLGEDCDTLFNLVLNENGRFDIMDRTR